MINGQKGRAKMLQNRNIQSDFIRVNCMISVIALHSLVFISQPIIGKVIRTLLFFCNPLFFMLSGKYNLKFETGKDEKKDYYFFYAKKIINIVFPFILYSLIIFLVNMRKSDITILQGMIRFLKAFFTNNIDYHLWFMYKLIIYLLSAPFLSKMLKNLSDIEIKILMVIGFIWNFVSILLMTNIFNVKLGFSGWILDGWIYYFIMGYFCDRIKELKHKKTISLCTLTAFVLTICIACYFPQYTKNLWDLSPIYTIYVLGIYLLFDRVILIKSRIIIKIVSFLAKYSFSVYLIHTLVLRAFQKFVGLIHVNMINQYILYMLSIVSVLLLSTILAFIIDNILVNPIKKAMKKILLGKYKNDSKEPCYGK